MKDKGEGASVGEGPWAQRGRSPSCLGPGELQRPGPQVRGEQAG